MCGKRHKCSFSRLEVVLIVFLVLMIAVTVALLVLHFLTQENSSSNGKLSYFGTAQLSAIQRAWWNGGRIQEEGGEMQKHLISSCGSRGQEPFSGPLASDNHPKMKKSHGGVSLPNHL